MAAVLRHPKVGDLAYPAYSPQQAGVVVAVRPALLDAAGKLYYRQVMRTIHKYRLPMTHGPYNAFLPAGAVILTAGVDFAGHGVYWALVDSTAPNVIRPMFVAYTGNDAPPDSATYRGTATTPSGLVLHLFELAT
jgi:hypothetical protein